MCSSCEWFSFKLNIASEGVFGGSMARGARNVPAQKSKPSKGRAGPCKLLPSIWWRCYYCSFRIITCPGPCSYPSKATDLERMKKRHQATCKDTCHMCDAKCGRLLVVDCLHMYFVQIHSTRTTCKGLHICWGGHQRSTNRV